MQTLHRCNRPEPRSPRHARGGLTEPRYWYPPLRLQVAQGLKRRPPQRRRRARHRRRRRRRLRLRRLELCPRFLRAVRYRVRCCPQPQGDLRPRLRHQVPPRRCRRTQRGPRRRWSAPTSSSPGRQFRAFRAMRWPGPRRQIGGMYRRASRLSPITTCRRAITSGGSGRIMTPEPWPRHPHYGPWPPSPLP